MSEIERDGLPEYCHYRDEGCELFSCCLDCPLTRCVYEMAWGKQRWLKGQRNREILRLFTVEAKGVEELAHHFGVSQRTVQRALGGYRMTPPNRRREQHG